MHHDKRWVAVCNVLRKVKLVVFEVLSVLISGYTLVGVFFFFFQAEDGIRDLTVTGVQTCALPICRKNGYKWKARFEREGRRGLRDRARRPHCSPRQISPEWLKRIRRVRRAHRSRSEERRVGKECRSRWSPYH